MRYILNENFDTNKMGWNEERTKAHKMEISQGFLYIYSYDTSASRSSNYPMDNSFLLDFPADYDISSAITLLNHSSAAEFGIILISGSLEYKISVNDSGISSIREWDYNRKSEILIVSKSINIKFDKPTVVFELKVRSRDFELYVNNEKIGEGNLKSKSWREIRIFTSSGSAIAADYLRIKNVDLDDAERPK